MRMNRRRKAAPKPVHVETLIADSLGARGDAVMAGPVFTPGLLPGEGAKVEVQGQRVVGSALIVELRPGAAPSALMELSIEEKLENERIEADR